MVKRIFNIIIASLIIVLLSTMFVHAVTENAGEGGSKKEIGKIHAQKTYGSLPLYFIENDGQVDKSIRFYEKGAGHTTFFTKEGVYLSLMRRQNSEDRTQKDAGQTKFEIGNLQSEFIKLIPLNAKKDSAIIAEGLQDGKVNYFIGNDPKKWKTNIPTYKTVAYKEIYKGIDMKFYGNNSQLEYDIIVRPGADPSSVKLSYEGIEALRVTDEGNLEIALKEGKLIQKKPYIYQEIGGKRVEIEGSFRIFRLPLYSYGFQLASYDKSSPLFIDPVITYSTYLGGSSSDIGLGIAADSAGSTYITGETQSTDFPTISPLQGTFSGNVDAFVTKIDTSGASLIYSTYIGGSLDERGYGIAVDTSGNAYITGGTYSRNFPVSSPVYGTHAGGYFDAFITKINSSGSSLIYSTYIGGSNEDWGFAIALDSSNNAYITGQTLSTDFPTVSPIQGTHAGGVFDAFITKINASGTAIDYSTYLGGSGDDRSFAIAVDSSSNAHITGYTWSTDFPTASAIQGSHAGGYIDAFVTKINSSGSSLIYSTYLGGSEGQDVGYGIAVDTSGNAYITGVTSSTSFPTVSPIQAANAGYMDAFITKINPSGSSLVYSTYLGGSIADPGHYGTDIGLGIAVDSSNNAYVAGFTETHNFPTVSPVQGAFGGNIDVFITKINSSGASIDYSTYLGGSGDDRGYGIAIDASGNAYITGQTQSTDFPTVSAIYGTYAGNTDAFVAKIGETITGTVWAWGANSAGQLGDGTTTNRYTAGEVSGLLGVMTIAGGSNYSLALKSDGTVWSWGDNWSGKLGDGTTTQRNTPVQVSGLTNVTAIATKDAHTLALINDGTVWTWGYNGAGRLGDGTTTSRYTPVQVSGLTGVVSIGAGNSHSMAIKNDGTVWTWGYNFYGQLGDGTMTNRSTPVQVSGLTGATAITGGYYYTVALKSDGTVWTWGRNDDGQLGDGTTTQRTTPVQVNGLTGVIDIETIGTHTVALKNDGTVWTWGANYYGQLGDGTTTNRYTPVQVSGLTGVIDIAAGGSHSIALKSDGTVWIWGNNTFGQLGDGTTMSRYTPIQVSGLTSVTAISAGGDHSIAIK